MMTWDALVHKQSNKEIKYIIVAVIVVLLGFLNEIWIRCGQAVFVVHNYESIALAILQIQATVFTLSIALIALLAGFITDRYLGIRYNDFIFNIKPRYLKQKIVIAAELLLLLAGIVMQMIACYNMVFALFVVACILIWFSVTEVYRVFAEASSLEDEIRAFLQYSFKNNNQAGELTRRLCEQWKRELLNQDDASFRLYLGTFEDAFASMFPNDENRHALLEQCVSISRMLLGNTDTTRRGLNYIWRCYIWASNYISETLNRENGLEILSSQKQSFSLFAYTYYYIVKGLERVDIDEVRNYISLWDSFTKITAKVATCLNQTETNDYYGSDLDAVKRLGSFIGDYLSTKFEPDYLSKNYDSLLKCALIETTVNDCEIPDNSPHKQVLESAIAERDFNLKVQLILNGADGLIRDYYAEIRRRLNQMSEPFARNLIRFHCFLYYLAFYESEDCIGAETKRKASGILNEQSVKGDFWRILFKIIGDDKNIKVYFGKKYDIFRSSLISDFIESMEPYQQFHDNDTFIGNKMSNAAEDFIVFLILFVEQITIEPELLDRIIPYKQAESLYYKYILKTESRDSLKRFLNLMGRTEGEIDKWVEVSLCDFKMILLKKIKIYRIQKAKQTQKLIDKELKENQQQIENELKAELEHDFSGILRDVRGHPHVYELFQSPLDVDFSLHDFMTNITPYIFKNAVISLADHLLRLQKINDRNDFKTDQDKLDYIRMMRRDHEFIGSELVLEPMDYTLANDFNDEFRKTRHCTTEGNGYMLVLKNNSLGISVDRVWIESRPETIADVEIEKEPDTGEYLYEVTSGIVIPFTEEELNDYLRESTRIVKIYASVRMEIMDGMIGEVINAIK